MPRNPAPRLKKNDKEKTDHRIRTGAQRRARTRQRIVEAALRVFAERGPDVPVIDDFIVAAGVARGTFYNHFRTTDELLTATSNWLEDDLITAIETVNSSFDDPLRRLATGIRLWLHLSRGDAVFCAFLVRSRFRSDAVERHIARDLKGGLRSGRLELPSLEVARDVLVGAVREAQVRMIGGRVPRSYPEDVARLILRALRVDERAIEDLVRTPLPEVARTRSHGSAPRVTEPSTPA